MKSWQRPSKFAIRLALFYGALFLIYGLHLPYFPVWLEHRGFSSDAIAWIIAAPLFLRIFLTPTLSALADANQRHREFIVVLALAAATISLALASTHMFWLIVIASLAFSIAFTSIMPLTETIAMSGVRASGLDYGRMRLWGSATFIIASFLGSAIIETHGSESIIWLLCTAAAIVFSATLLLPKPIQPSIDPAALKTQAAPWPVPAPANIKPQTFTPATSLLRSQTFVLFLIASGLAQASHATYYAFATLQWLHEGIPAIWIGALWVIGVLAEIALFACSSAIIQRTGPLTLILTGATAGVIRWSIMALGPPLFWLVPLQLLHGFTYGATHLGAIHFIARAVSPERIATAQAFYGVIGNGIAMAVATIISGWLFGMIRSETFFAMAALSALSLVTTIAVARRWNGDVLTKSP